MKFVWLQVLDRLDLNDTTVQHVLLASIPQLPDLAMPQVLPIPADRPTTLPPKLSLQILVLKQTTSI